MPPILHELVEFSNTGKVGPTLSKLAALLGAPALRVVAIKVLGWLQYRARRVRPTDMPLQLTPAYPWCSQLRTALSASPELAAVFQIEGESLSFSARISPEERKAIERLVGQGLEGRLMT